MARILMALASRDFDPTEAAIPWNMLQRQGHSVHFATADGARAYADPWMLTGAGLDLWSGIPGLRNAIAVGALLRANRDARDAYAELEKAPHFLAPSRFDALNIDAWDGLLLPGGHRAAGIRPYLEDASLRAFVAGMFTADKPVGAICHGVVVAARASVNGRSVLYGRKTTALTWKQEKTATVLTNITRFWDPNYYRTYLEEPGEAPGYRSVEAEVTRALKAPSDFQQVPREDPKYSRKTNGLYRDSRDDARPAFVVRDGNYVSARWPGDAFEFARVFGETLV